MECAISIEGKVYVCNKIFLGIMSRFVITRAYFIVKLNSYGSVCVPYLFDWLCNTSFFVQSQLSLWKHMDRGNATQILFFSLSIKINDNN